tara:strand:- start:448 stop:1644 length:1197 start_codon:yes stop_codon:yes gene_type:complete
MKQNKFVIEPSNGWWGIAQEGSEEDLSAELKKKKLPAKDYKGIHSIILNTTNQCNLDCVYCSASENRSEEKISEEVAKKVIDELVKLKLTPRIVFHGSEPLLNMPLIRSTVEYGESKERNILFYIQSNLTTLTNKKLAFIKDHQIGVSTSIDGFAEQHNRTRPFRGEFPSYDKIVENMGRVLEFQDGMCTATVVTKYNVGDMAEIALDLERRGVTHIQFLPSVKCSGADKDFRPSNEALTRGYIDLIEQTFRRMETGEQTATIKNISQLYSSLFQRTGVDNCRICSATDYHPILGVDIDGGLFPCDYFFGREEYKIGNVMTDSLESVLNSPRNPRSQSIEDTSCSSCDVKRVCGGSCMADRLFSGDKPYYCETYADIFKYIGGKIPELWEKGLIGKLL